MTDLAYTLPADWNELDWKAVNSARLLAADAVQKVGNGHPGTAISLAPVAYQLFQKTMRHDPTDPTWIGRDRFILSCGHSSLTLYLQLFLGGFGLEIDDLKALRTWDSLTPGHPEYGHTAGVESTTGPLGQGVAMAVGMAMAQRRERGLFDPEAPAGTSPFDHDIYCICSEGDLEEGVSAEAASLAGTQKLGNLTVLYDKNQISIEDDTIIAYTEDTAARFESYGWHVQVVDWRAEAAYHENLEALEQALAAAKAVTDKPSFILMHTIIGYPCPTLRNTGKSHGSALGDAEIRATKELVGLNPDEQFAIADEVLAHTRKLQERGQQAKAQWQKSFTAWQSANPERAALLERMSRHELPEGWDVDLPVFAASEKGVATRAASGDFLTAAAPKLPELWGGSADLAGSNNTTPKGEPSFLADGHSSASFSGTPYGRVLHFGIREHAMGAIMNGILLHGNTRVYGGTFFVFSDYMRPAVRLASLMHQPALYVWTHDSIGVGEDGPTHQPVEHLAAARAIPGLDVVRPMDANETVEVWKKALTVTDHPLALILSRQNLPTVPRGEAGFAQASEAAKGGYILRDCAGTPDVILIATGSEVSLALTAQQQLELQGIQARVVSMPCVEWFEAQDQAYRDAVLPPAVRARVTVEAGIAMCWHKYLGDAGEAVALEHFGASADGALLFEKFGFTPEAIVTAAQRSLAKVR